MQNSLNNKYWAELFLAISISIHYYNTCQASWKCIFLLFQFSQWYQNGTQRRYPSLSVAVMGWGWMWVRFFFLLACLVFYLLTEFCCWPILCWLSKFSPRKFLSCTKSKGHGWKTSKQGKMYKNAHATQEIPAICLNTNKKN